MSSKVETKLSRIDVFNYKAFDHASIEIKPITVLLGANSVGKSSIVQLFLMLQQTGKAGLNSYKSALKLYGGYVNLGDGINIFRKKDTSKPVKFSFNLTSNQIGESLRNDYREAFIRQFEMVPMIFPIKGFSDLRGKTLNSKSEFSKFLDSVFKLLKRPICKEITGKKLGALLGIDSIYRFRNLAQRIRFNSSMPTNI